MIKLSIISMIGVMKLISNDNKKLKGYESTKDYQYHWKWLNGKGDDINCSDTINGIQALFEQLQLKNK